MRAHSIVQWRVSSIELLDGFFVEGMKNEPKYRRSARRELSGAQWRRLGVVIGTLMIAVIVVVVVALLVALGEIAF